MKKLLLPLYVMIAFLSTGCAGVSVTCNCYENNTNHALVSSTSVGGKNLDEAESNCSLKGTSSTYCYSQH